jgi:hypothetical protein
MLISMLISMLTSMGIPLLVPSAHDLRQVEREDGKEEESSPP